MALQHIISNPSLFKANSAFIEFANIKKTRILNSQNSAEIWPFISQMIRHYGSSEIDVNDEKLLTLFQKTGWIEARIFESLDVNAYAFNVEGVQLLVFNLGLLLLIRDTFHSLLSTREFLPELGNPENETVSLEQFKKSYYESKFEHKYFQNIPLDETRKICAEKMTELALHFVYAHEATHLAFCHFNYINSKYGISSYEEFPSVYEPKQLAFDKKCLELSADLGATRFTLMFIKKTWTQNEKYFNKNDAYTIWLYTLAILFKIMEPKGMFIESNFSSHPNHLIRSMNIHEESMKEAQHGGLIKSVDKFKAAFDKLYNLHSLFKSIDFFPIDVGVHEDNIEKYILYKIRLEEIERTELKVLIEEKNQIIKRDYEWLLSQRSINQK